MTDKSFYTVRMGTAAVSDYELTKYRSLLMNRISRVGRDTAIEVQLPHPSQRIIAKSPRIAFEPERSNTEASVIFTTQIAGKPRTVYLYFQLQNITNLPQQNDKRYFLNLRHNLTHYSESREITGNRRVGSFSIPIEQSADIANYFSDEPLVLSITEILIPDPEETPEDLTNALTVALGQIDIIPFLTNRRSILNKDVFLYPASVEYINVEGGTCKTAWHVYSLMPIMKQADFNNMIFLTLESIYNASSDIMDISDDLAVSMSFHSKIPDEEGKFPINEICAFEVFDKGIIGDQDPKYYWATVATTGKRNLGNATDCSLTIHKIFQDLLCTENVDFNFDKISIHSDEALVCNLMRRYILTEEWTNTLEEVIAFDEQDLLVEVYQKSEPDIILLRGYIDLSIFLYPNVNSCRFAVELRPVDTTLKPTTSKQSSITQVRSGSKLKTASKTTITTETTINARNKDGKVTFAIVNICTLQPITINQMLRNTFKTQAETAKMCVPEKYLMIKPLKKNKVDICEESYKNFDSQINILTDYIIRKEVQDIEDAKGFLCCQKSNLTQKIMKLIACDFNIKIPTKNNIEFANLMTYVYKKLEDRCYEFLVEHQRKKNLVADSDRIKKLVLFMNTIKLLKECGEEELVAFYEKKLSKMETAEFHVDGYLFLYNMEKQNFDEAKLHIQKPIREKFLFGEFYDKLFGIYIKYMEILKSETTYNEALEYLISTLEKYSGRFLKEPSMWVLLHCLYKSCGYNAGTTFTRWRYENLHNQDDNKVMLPHLPLSLWNLYCQRNLEFTTKRSILFYKTFKIFTKLGLYKFAQIIFKEIQNECTEAEKYFVNTTLKILLKEIKENYQPRSFQGLQNRIFQSHINGHLHYYLGDYAAATDHYAILTDNTAILEDIEIYQMSIMRRGNYFQQMGRYIDAIIQFKQIAYIKCCKMQAYFNMGKAYYYLGKYDKAEQHLSLSTNCGIHIPDVWAYLALVNLRAKNVVRALESWKYAKFNPDNVISTEIYDELDKIDMNDVTLIIDYNKLSKSPPI